MEGRDIYTCVRFNVVIIGIGGAQKGISNGLEEEKILL